MFWGKWFAFQHYGVEPDLMTLAKTLGGGVPIGAFVVSDRVSKQVFTAGTHGSTYGGNPLVTAASLAVFKAIKKHKLLTHTVEMGQRLEKELSLLQGKYDIIKEIRGLGLMRAMELTIPAAGLVEKAQELGLLINATQETVVRIFPAMTVTPKEMKKAIQVLDQSFAAVVGSGAARK